MATANHISIPASDQIDDSNFAALNIKVLYVVAARYIQLRLEHKDAEARNLYDKHTRIMRPEGQAAFDQVINELFAAL